MNLLHPHLRMKPTTYGACFLNGLGQLLMCLGLSAPAIAQIVPDTTLPVNSTVPPNCLNCTIDGGSVRGGNLFHSFTQFSVPTGGSAYFNNPVNIQSIISRVTGPYLSTIDGLIQANGGANLIFINPNGIIFGSNARLNIGGSFLASTARSIGFADGFVFSATPQDTPLLTSSIPVGLGFQNPGSIQVQGQGHSLVTPTFVRPPSGLGTNPGLSVRPGQTLAMLGGDVILDGGVLNAPGGHVELASVGEGNVRLLPSLSGWQFAYEPVQRFNNLWLTNRSLADTSGLGGNSINVQGRNIRVDHGSVLTGFNTGTIPSGNLTLNATESIRLSGTDPIARTPGFISNTTGGRAPGGAIEVSSPLLILSEGGMLGTQTFGDNPAGDVRIRTSPAD
jgi:filamentous hemagglutinin family protein